MLIAFSPMPLALQEWTRNLLWATISHSCPRAGSVKLNFSPQVNFSNYALSYFAPLL